MPWNMSIFQSEHELVFTYGFYLMVFLALVGALSLVYGLTILVRCMKPTPIPCLGDCEKVQCVAVKHELAWALTRRDMLERENEELWQRLVDASDMPGSEDSQDSRIRSLEAEIIRLQEIINEPLFSSRNESFKTSFLSEFMKLRVAVTRSGEAFHACDCRYANAPHTHTNRIVRPCQECIPGAVRGVLEFVEFPRVCMQFTE